MEKVSYWDLDSLIHYELDQFCERRNLSTKVCGDKDELVNIFTDFINRNLEYYRSKEELDDLIEEAKESGREDAYDEGYNHAREEMENHEQYISTEESMNREKRSYREGFIKGFKDGTDWKPAPKDYPELKDY